jgi:hypothetical protein
LLEVEMQEGNTMAFWCGGFEKAARMTSSLVHWLRGDVNAFIKGNRKASVFRSAYGGFDYPRLAHPYAGMTPKQIRRVLTKAMKAIP